VVSSRQPDDAMAVIRETATRLEAPLYVEGVDFASESIGYPKFNFQGSARPSRRTSIRIVGKASEQNAAVAACGRRGPRGRGIIMANRPCATGNERALAGQMELVDGDPKIVIDGTHNVGGASVLAKALDDEFPGASISLVTGMQVTKDLDGFMRILAPRLKAVHAVPIREMQCYPTSKVAEVARKNGLDAFEHSDGERRSYSRDESGEGRRLADRGIAVPRRRDERNSPASPGRVAMSNVKHILLALILVASTASAQTLVPSDLDVEEGPISLTSDQVVYWRLEDRFVASGNVVLTTTRFTLTCDELEVWNKEGEYEARGHVVITGPEGDFKSDSIRFNVKTKDGVLVNSNLTSPRFTRISSRSASRRSGAGQYLITGLSFTPCLCDEASAPTGRFARRPRGSATAVTRG